MADLTFGQQAVGLTFNPSGDQTVNDVKQSFADVIDVLNTLRDNASDSEVKRLCSIAITEAQGAQMWAVKAVTWKTPASVANAPADTTPSTDTPSAPADTDGDSDTEAGTTGDETPATPSDSGTPAAEVNDPAPTNPNPTASA